MKIQSNIPPCPKVCWLQSRSQISSQFLLLAKTSSKVQNRPNSKLELCLGFLKLLRFAYKKNRRPMRWAVFLSTAPQPPIVVFLTEKVHPEKLIFQLSPKIVFSHLFENFAKQRFCWVTFENAEYFRRKTSQLSEVSDFCVKKKLFVANEN